MSKWAEPITEIILVLFLSPLMYIFARSGYIGRTGAQLSAFFAAVIFARAIFKLVSGSEGRTDIGDTGLMRAAREGRRDLVQEWLNTERTEVNAKSRGGKTALMCASYFGHREVVEALVAKGADVNAKDNNGNDALQVATLRGHREVVDVLIGSGAEIPPAVQTARCQQCGASFTQPPNQNCPLCGGQGKLEPPPKTREVLRW